MAGLALERAVARFHHAVSQSPSLNLSSVLYSGSADTLIRPLVSLTSFLSLDFSSAIQSRLDTSVAGPIVSLLTFDFLRTVSERFMVRMVHQLFDDIGRKGAILGALERWQLDRLVDLLASTLKSMLRGKVSGLNYPHHP